MKSSKTLEKCNFLHALSSRDFFVQKNLAQKLFFDFEVTYFDEQKQQKNWLENEMKRVWTSNQIGRKLWSKLYRPPNIDKQDCKAPFSFLLLNSFESCTSLNKASNGNASKGEELVWKVPILTSIDAQKRSRTISLLKWIAFDSCPWAKYDDLKQPINCENCNLQLKHA